jgi:hypothetical protein
LRIKAKEDVSLFKKKKSRALIAIPTLVNVSDPLGSLSGGI